VVAQHLPLLLAGHKSLQNEPPPAKVWLGTCRVAVLKPQRHFGSVQPTCYCIVVQAMPPHKQEDDYNGGSFLLVLRNGHLQIRSHKNRLNKGNATWLDSRHLRLHIGCRKRALPLTSRTLAIGPASERRSAGLNEPSTHLACDKSWGLPCGMA
jgi:hypothetical protein